MTVIILAIIAILYFISTGKIAGPGQSASTPSCGGGLAALASSLINSVTQSNNAANAAANAAKAAQTAAAAAAKSAMPSMGGGSGGGSGGGGMVPLQMTAVPMPAGLNTPTPLCACSLKDAQSASLDCFAPGTFNSGGSGGNGVDPLCVGELPVNVPGGSCCVAEYNGPATCCGASYQGWCGNCYSSGCFCYSYGGCYCC